MIRGEKNNRIFSSQTEIDSINPILLSNAFSAVVSPAGSHLSDMTSAAGNQILRNISGMRDNNQNPNRDKG